MAPQATPNLRSTRRTASPARGNPSSKGGGSGPAESKSKTTSSAETVPPHKADTAAPPTPKKEPEAQQAPPAKPATPAPVSPPKEVMPAAVPQEGQGETAPPANSAPPEVEQKEADILALAAAPSDSESEFGGDAEELSQDLKDALEDLEKEQRIDSWADHMHDIDAELDRRIDRLFSNISLGQLLTEMSSWAPFDEVEEQLRDDPHMHAHTEIEHDYLSGNRELDASWGADVFLVEGRYADVKCNPPADDKYTRLFESVGHFIPNLIVSTPAGPKFVIPHKWRKLADVPSNFRFPTAGIPTPRGWTRYRLVNGKLVDFKSSKAPKFAQFPPLPEMMGYGTYGVALTLNKLEASEYREVRKFTPSELFDLAVTRAGGLEKVKLLPYGRPPTNALPDSKHYQGWLFPRTSDPLKIKLEPVQTHVEALLESIAAIEKGALTEEERVLLEAIKSALTAPDVSPEFARRVYEDMVRRMSGGDFREVAKSQFTIGPTKILKQHVDLAEIVLHVGGMPFTVPVLRGTVPFELPHPAFIAPEGASIDTVRMLSRYASLSDRITVSMSEFTHTFPWYVLSIRPKGGGEGAGALPEGATWFEKLQAKVSYRGPIYFARDTTDRTAARWATIFNSVYVEEAMLLGKVFMFPRIHLYRGGAIDDELLQELPVHARGVGIARGRLVLTPLASVRSGWEEEARQDARLLFPFAVVEAVVNHPNLYTVVNAEEYLDGTEPLRVCVNTTKGPVTVLHNAGMRFAGEQSELENMVSIPAPSGWPQASGAGSEGGARLLESPSVRSEASTARTHADVARDPLHGFPLDRNHASWQVRLKGDREPHNRLTVFGDKPLIAKVGDWSLARKALSPQGGITDTFKHYYTVHWVYANTEAKHPVVQYHHPAWTTSLRGEAYKPEWWEWPRGKLAPLDVLSTNSLGQSPLFGLNALQALQRAKKKAFQHEHWSRASVQSESEVRQNPPAMRGGAGQPRGGRGRGRGAPPTAQPTSIQLVAETSGPSPFQQPPAFSGPQTQSKDWW